MAKNKKKDDDGKAKRKEAPIVFEPAKKACVEHLFASTSTPKKGKEAAEERLKQLTDLLQEESMDSFDEEESVDPSELERR